MTQARSGPVLVRPREGEPFVEVGAGSEVSTTTCRCYVDETVGPLARRPRSRVRR
ncbi:hypothetical protein F4559_005578 [Saccharothrix violaceirubra]|uniref:Uncharacterized protein n=1 Tax=Saccharothrix violaceirubra TaxID=413306 RepID=A0A7W7T7X0_9PSEU|nr:hypothetical protein [Saccharothrix violaceirubra]